MGGSVVSDYAGYLRTWGLQVLEVAGHESRSNGYPLHPQGDLFHHTAIPFRTLVGDVAGLSMLVNGHASLFGPLCNDQLRRSGTVALIATNGAANHAGKGGLAGLDSNSDVSGTEAENDGVGEPWPAVQVEAKVRLSAAKAHWYGYDPSHSWGHREWAPDRKIDPTGIDLDAYRARVLDRYERGPSGAVTPARTIIIPEGANDMQVYYDDRGGIYLAGGLAGWRHITTPEEAESLQAVFGPARHVNDRQADVVRIAMLTTRDELLADVKTSLTSA